MINQGNYRWDNQHMVIKGETESLRAAQNNDIRTNYIKAKIDNSKENNKWRLSGEMKQLIS